MHLLTEKSPPDAMTAWAGGKAANLHALTAHGFDVPAWTALGADVFEHVMERSGLREDVAGLLADPAPAELEKAARHVAARLESMPLGDDVLALVEAAYDRVGGGDVAVRSSGVEEDSAAHSFAGQFSSYLHVEGLEEVVAAVRRCWASAYSARAMTYRLSHGLPAASAAMAVIVQRMVPAEVSGVMFTTNPASGDPDETVVSCVHGLGEGLVSGAVDADTVTLRSLDHAIVDVVVGEKAERYDRDPAGSGCLVTEVPEAARKELAVDEPMLWRLVELGRRMEEALGGPQDVEWAVADGRPLVLQSRPITTLPERPLPDPRHRVWDNSNIIESYAGVTSPLTFTFARHVYYRAHLEYCRMLGIRGARLAEMNEWLPTMLGYFHGRVYYNLFNWYRTMRLVPFYRLNQGALETSMGLTESLDAAVAEDLRPCTPGSPAAEALVNARILVNYVRRVLTNPREVDAFVAHFDRTFRHLDGLDYTRLPAGEAYRLFQEFDRKIMPRWGPMVVLELVILTSFATLRECTGRWLPDAPAWFLWSAVSPGDQIESAAPARALGRLVERFKADPRHERALRDAATMDELYAALRDADGGGLAADIDAYIDEYGYRSLNELKLEEPDLRQDPSVLLEMLRVGLVAEGHQAAGPSSAEADAYVDERLSGARKFVYKLVRGKVRRSLEARERVRFCRTRAFGLVRRMMLAIGADLARSGMIGSARDVFLLRLDEVAACLDGTYSHGDLRPLIELRKAELERFGALDAPARFTTTGLIYDRRGLTAGGWVRPGADGHDGRDGAVEPGHRFEGTPCSPGTAEGEARVVERPQDAAGGVIVTYRTDPGWISALPAAKALLIERGSPLTHIAIVARELGVPAIVQIKDVTRKVRDGMRLRVDGTTGTATVTAAAPAPAAAAPADAEGGGT
ncbi:phosphoenolpyruvate synthase [Actinomadura terrae]|uniref:phosphoenolpyruvate synthase n=1 Tax=Actinomadura terrae TaxID=604353 RepID=UPI001FA742A1|nr:phosphoenolpyruvate synthase [Actinomadura terrae]